MGYNQSVQTRDQRLVTNINLEFIVSEKRYAAVIECSYTIQGNERSRTNPGHGYASETVTYHSLRCFDNKTEMGNWVIGQASRLYPDKFKIIEYVEIQVTTSVSVHYSGV